MTIACSSRSLAERSSCSPRWSSTAGSALRRVEPASASVPARSPSRRTSSSGLAARKVDAPRPTAKTWHCGKASRSTPRTAAAVVRPGRVHLDLAGEDDLAQRAGADALDRARDGLLVVARRHGGHDPDAAGGVGVQQWQRRLAQPGRARLEAAQELVGDVVRPRDGGEGEADLVAPAVQRDLGHVQRGRREPRPVRGVAARVGEGEAAHGDGTGPARPARVVAGGAHDELAPARRDRGEAPRPRGLEDVGRAQRGQRGPGPRRLLEGEPRLVAPARGDAHGRRVDVGGHGDGDRGQRAARTRPPRPPHGLPQAGGEAVAVGRPQGEPAAAGGAQRHRCECTAGARPAGRRRRCRPGPPPTH